MSDRIQAIRGMNDTLPDTTEQWRKIESVLAECVNQYGYQEIRFPILESTQLFKRTIGEVTDIVEKEMYTFTDLNGDSLTLRPEGTAGCVRACLQHGLLYNQQPKLWYTGPMFRHEKPQKGRYRQFNQFGVEVFGISGVNIELELIAMCKRLWHKLGLAEHVHLQINTLGNLNERKAYREALINYLKPHYDILDEDSKRRLEKNPLRILDSKNPDIQSMVSNAPKLLDVIGEESKQHFEALCDGLKALDIAYTVNPFLVRGLDYYGQTVFEWVTDKLGSQATVCAGGRFDMLVEQLGGNPTPAIGFAIGIERLLLLQQTIDVDIGVGAVPFVYFIAINEHAVQKALYLSELIRDAFSNCGVVVHTAGGSFKSQFKKADKSGAHIALILGEDEMNNNTISIKSLRTTEEQKTVLQPELCNYLKHFIN